MKTLTETRPLATNAAVLRALGIKDKYLISVTLEMGGDNKLPKLTLVRALHETDPVDHIGGLDLDAMCKDALARVRRHINTVADRHLAVMLRSWVRYQDAHPEKRERPRITIHRIGDREPQEIES